MKTCRITSTNARRIAGVLALAAVATVASVRAQDGLAVPTGDGVWPQLQARLTLQTTGPSVLARGALARDAEATAARGVRGGALFGDYVLLRRDLGELRATGGVVLGSLAGSPTLAPGGGRFGLGLLEAPAAQGPLAPTSAFDAAALPYLGLGYRSPPLWQALSLSADVGLVTTHPSGAAGVGRALLGQQAMDAALRELRLAPMLQLGVRYAF